MAGRTRRTLAVFAHDFEAIAETQTPAQAASLATLGLAAVWLAHPGAAGAPGRLWDVLAVVWALALALASGRDIRRS